MSVIVTVPIIHSWVSLVIVQYRFALFLFFNLKSTVWCHVISPVEKKLPAL